MRRSCCESNSEDTEFEGARRLTKDRIFLKGLRLRAGVGIRAVRWWIVAVLFCGSVANYLDRVALSIVAPTIRDEFGLSNIQYAWIVNTFLVAYTFSYALGGRVADWLGTRLSFYLSVSWWSVVASLHSLCQGFFSLAALRFLLGMGEAGFFPSEIKAISEWFHPSDRGKAVGVLLMGISVGALLAPPVVAGLTLRYGWRTAFLLTGILGFFLLIPWSFLYRNPGQHPWVSAKEREYLSETRAVDREVQGFLGMGSFLRHRAVWTLISARVLADSSWYFYLFWTPEYLVRERSFSMAMVGGLLWVPFLAADLGNVAGGWTSSFLIRRGFSISFSRKACMVGFTAIVPLGIFVNTVSGPGWVIALLALSLFGFAGWAANVHTVITDLAPSHSVGTLFGLAGCAGSIGAIFLQGLIGHLADRGEYSVVFWLVGGLPVISGLIMLSAPIRRLGEAQRT